LSDLVELLNDLAYSVEMIFLEFKIVSGNYTFCSINIYSYYLPFAILVGTFETEWL